MHQNAVVEGQKSVSESRRNEKLAVVGRRQQEALPLQVGRRLRPQIHDRIEDPAVQALHQFGHAKIVVQPANDVARRPRRGILFPFADRQMTFAVLGLGPDFLKIAAVVVKHVGHEYLRVGELRRVSGDHRAASACR